MWGGAIDEEDEEEEEGEEEELPRLKTFHDLIFCKNPFAAAAKEDGDEGEEWGRAALVAWLLANTSLM